jgi:hypothetical protein
MYFPGYQYIEAALSHIPILSCDDQYHGNAVSPGDKQN